MNPDIAQRLLTLNQQFYTARAAAFARSRGAGQARLIPACPYMPPPPPGVAPGGAQGALRARGAASARTGGGVGPLAFLARASDRFRADAFATGAVEVQGGRLQLTGADPFTTGRVTALGALRGETYRGDRVQFRLDRALFVTNDAAEVTRLEADFDDGPGIVSLTRGVDYEVRYDRHGTRPISVRAARAVQPGDVFVAVGRAAVDGDQFIYKTIENGGGGNGFENALKFFLHTPALRPVCPSAVHPVQKSTTSKHTPTEPKHNINIDKS